MTLGCCPGIAPAGGRLPPPGGVAGAVLPGGNLGGPVSCAWAASRPAQAARPSASRTQGSHGPGSLRLRRAMTRTRSRDISFSGGEQMHREQSVRIRPQLHTGPACLARQGAKRVHGVLVAVLGVNAFTGGEVNGAARDVNGLGAPADQMHLDPALSRVPQGQMGEVFRVEIRRRLSIEARPARFD